MHIRDPRPRLRAETFYGRQKSYLQNRVGFKDTHESGVLEVRVEHVPDPKVLNPRDAVVRITLTAICGSDLHLYDGYVLTMQIPENLSDEQALFLSDIFPTGYMAAENCNIQPADTIAV